MYLHTLSTKHCNLFKAYMNGKMHPHRSRFAERVQDFRTLVDKSVCQPSSRPDNYVASPDEHEISQASTKNI